MPEGTAEDAAARLHRFAHDLRNRLHTLWELARMDEGAGITPAERAEHLERVYFQAQRAVEELLDDMGVDRSVRAAEAVAVDLREVITEAARRESFRYVRKQQELNLDLPAGLCAVADRGLLVQLLAALLSNAGKFSAQGATVHVHALAHGAQVQVSVADHGTGLDPEDLARVFQRFVVTASRSTDGEPQARGTLARARQWAQAMGGALEARSEGPGRGSTFLLTLPAVTAPPA